MAAELLAVQQLTRSQRRHDDGREEEGGAEYRRPEDETKRKFREALEAKQGRQAEGEAHLDTEASQTQAHGPVDTKRTFRRKTG